VSIDARELRNVMGQFATGVTVVTTTDRTGQPYGLTANAFTSLSMTPPLALICVDKTAQCYACFEESKIFAINVLREDQEDVSRRFATKGIDKFVGLDWSKSTDGHPLLGGALAQIECRIVNSYDGGDHTILVGEIVGARAFGERPLLFFQGKYHRLGSP